MELERYIQPLSMQSFIDEQREKREYHAVGAARDPLDNGWQYDGKGILPVFNRINFRYLAPEFISHGTHP